MNQEETIAFMDLTRKLMDGEGNINHDLIEFVNTLIKKKLMEKRLQEGAKKFSEDFTEVFEELSEE